MTFWIGPARGSEGGSGVTALQGLGAGGGGHSSGIFRSVAPLAAKAKRAIHINLFGGLSQVDSFDYKPELAKHHGKKYGGIETAMSSSAGRAPSQERLGVQTARSVGAVAVDF